MTIELSTDQLRCLSEDGRIRIFEGHSEEYTEIVAADLDISLGELAAGKVAHTPEGVEVRY